jgi:hypothetical protein
MTQALPPEPFRAFPADDPIRVADDPIEEWLLWEEQANLIGFRTSTRPISISVARVDPEAVEVLRVAGAPRALVQRFLRPGGIRFPRHPLNRDPAVAFFTAKKAEEWIGRYTSSRTLVVRPRGEAPLFSLKLATDRPHPDFVQPEKTKLREEARDAIRWVELLGRIDRLLGPPRTLHVVREVLAVLVPGTESGFLVRDLRLFQSGNHYLPALSIPWVGHPIARLHGRDFASFWGEFYAEAVGTAKAEFFARSGLQFETPNPQNVLVELDRRLYPTGHIVLRDLGDALCATDALVCAREPWTQLLHDLRPETRNSFWAFDEAGDHSVPAEVLQSWLERHDRAYLQMLARFFPALAPAAALDPEPAFAHWNSALRDSQRAVVEAFGALRIPAPRRTRPPAPPS